jgi:hypothetical protein
MYYAKPYYNKILIHCCILLGFSLQELYYDAQIHERQVYKMTNLISDKNDECDEKSSSSKPPLDIVSAAIMAKVLEERERERLNVKHCDSCTCPRQALVHCSTQATPVMDQGILCVRCAASLRFVVIIH